MKKTLHRFAASLFHPDFGDEPVSGTIVIVGRVLRFESEATVAEIAFEALETDFTDTGQGIYFNDAATPIVRIYCADPAVLRYPAIKSHPVVAAMLSRRETSRAVRLTLYFAGICILATWLGSLAVSAMVGAIVASVPMSYEEKLGQAELAGLKESGMLMAETNDATQLATLAAPLIQVLPAERRNITFHVVDEAEPNAFALPGGHVVVNTGLLKLVDTPEQLLGVLAHELAHLTKRHAIRREVSSAGPFVIFGLFMRSGSGVGGLMMAGSGLMIFQGFSQEYETEADLTGWDYLVAANINPRGMIEALQKLESAEEGVTMHGAVPEAFRSHPALPKRIARLEKRWSRLGKQKGFLELAPVTWTYPTPAQP